MYPNVSLWVSIDPCGPSVSQWVPVGPVVSPWPQCIPVVPLLPSPAVNNAGVGAVGPLEGTAMAELQRVVDTNVMGVVRAVRAVLPHMKRRRGGHIVVISSVMGRHGEGRGQGSGGQRSRGQEVRDWGQGAYCGVSSSVMGRHGEGRGRMVGVKVQGVKGQGVMGSKVTESWGHAIGSGLWVWRLWGGLRVTGAHRGVPLWGPSLGSLGVPLWGPTYGSPFGVPHRAAVQ